MIRNPKEPADTLLCLPLGDKVTKPENKPRVAPPFTEYTPIKGRPGWEDDGYGHLRYDATADAAKHERAVENKRVGLHLAQLEQHSLETLHAFDAQMDAQALPCDETHAQLQANVLRKERHECLPQDAWEQFKQKRHTARDYAEQHEQRFAPVHLVNYYEDAYDGRRLHRFTFSNGNTAGTEPIAGCSVSILEGDTRGRGPLVEWDTQHFADVGIDLLTKYLRGLRACMPSDVPLYQHRQGRKLSPILVPA